MREMLLNRMKDFGFYLETHYDQYLGELSCIQNWLALEKGIFISIKSTLEGKLYCVLYSRDNKWKPIYLQRQSKINRPYKEILEIAILGAVKQLAEEEKLNKQLF